MSPGKTRPRRSASMSEARGDEAHHGYNHQPSYARATATRGARRVTLEEKMRQEQELLYQSGTHTCTIKSESLRLYLHRCRQRSRFLRV
ncbi:uncharacterized protein PHACADRAFT_265115 [Phanerochaete carnosa HHB-10118-sp]|uniref:Uncharacterized protein n=1 Tax=Phanerochaete carnosa (strain HHB-10118-sp) TaxID=650164 RepID=K5WH74_PHACS|nr:uncharacterized protein PHACADRAFT_265115 [Phanerochaete carnosa HHB-10118-sp]EKM49572.1 hypothetical protein PHACADRAFT_265115 [Phanerochaete carnosa HHB-10118-sp]